jgi:serine/threonine-protein kinase RsbW
MSYSTEPLTINRVLPSNLTDYISFVEDLLARLELYGWNKEQLFGIHMALEESITNAIRHGNKHHPDKQVFVDCELSLERFYICVRDEGAGYNPCAVPDCCADENLEIPGGRGLALMRAYMDKVELTDNGRCVCMEKARN